MAKLKTFSLKGLSKSKYNLARDQPKYKKSGWYGDSRRHYLAAKGVKTSFRTPPSPMEGARFVAVRQTPSGQISVKGDVQKSDFQPEPEPVKFSKTSFPPPELRGEILKPKPKPKVKEFRGLGFAAREPGRYVKGVWQGVAHGKGLEGEQLKTFGQAFKPKVRKSLIHEQEEQESFEQQLKDRVTETQTVPVKIPGTDKLSGEREFSKGTLDAEITKRDQEREEAERVKRIKKAFRL